MSQVAWINEIHYDNSGVDSLEFVEIIVLDPVSSDSLQVFLYDGNSGMVYDSIYLGEMEPGLVTGDFHFYSWFPEAIQNGPDGISLSLSDSLILFASYEGVFTAADGPAAGVVSELLPVAESAVDPGLAVGLTGMGSESRHFWWRVLERSPGGPNQDQVLTSDPVIKLYGPDSIHFGNVPYGDASLPESIVMAGANLTEHIQLAIPEGFQVSPDDQFSIIFDAGIHELLISDNYFSPDTLFVRFTPLVENETYTGHLRINSASATDSMYLTGSEGPYLLPNAWINEFHYDNESTDENEFVEVVVDDRYIDEVNYLSLYFYNGNNGLQYKTTPSDEWIPGFYDPEGFQYFTAMVKGIQNGAADGIALTYRNRLIQFISYEGVMTAVDGPAAGMTSTDTGVMEETDSPLNSSLQLMGTGGNYSDFTWHYSPGVNTMNMPNLDQVLPVVLSSYRLENTGKSFMLSWTSEFEKDNAAYIVQYSGDGDQYDFLGTVMPKGHISNTYEFVIPPFEHGYVRLVQEDWNGRRTYFEPLKLRVPDRSEIRFEIYSMTGRVVRQGSVYEPVEINAIIAHLPKSLYLVREIRKSGERIRKVIRDD